MDNLEKRLANTELALHCLCSLIEDMLPPACSEDVSKMMNEYFEANRKLGSQHVVYFHE